MAVINRECSFIFSHSYKVYNYYFLDCKLYEKDSCCFYGKDLLETCLFFLFKCMMLIYTIFLIHKMLTL